MTPTEEMMRAAVQAMKLLEDEATANPENIFGADLTSLARAGITAALAAMWQEGDAIYAIDGEVLGFWKSKEPDLIGEFGITYFDGEVWVNPDDNDDAFRAPDYVMPLPSAPTLLSTRMGSDA